MLVQIAPIAGKVSAQILDGVISPSLECLKCTDCGHEPPECELQAADCFIFAFAGGHAYGCVMDAHILDDVTWSIHPEQSNHVFTTVILLNTRVVVNRVPRYVRFVAYFADELHISFHPQSMQQTGRIVVHG